MNGKTNPRTVYIAPYGEERLWGFETVAYLSGNAPHLLLRIGSDCVRLAEGQSLPADASYTAVVNPFPRGVEVTLAAGIPVSISAERTGLTLAQQVNSYSGIFGFNAGAAGLKWAFGVMMKRGSAVLECFETNNDGFSSVMIFPGAKPDFMAFKPAGCMTEAAAFRFPDGTADTSLFTVAGTYTDAMVTQWVTDSGYSGTPVTVKHGSFVSTMHRYAVETDQAVFFVRDVAKAVHCFGRLQHRGAGVEEFR